MVAATLTVSTVISVTAAAHAASLNAQPAPHGNGKSGGHLLQHIGPTPS
jgi:Spy/CpxP family protein refolding chaperone